MKEEIIGMNCAQFEEALHDLDRPGTQAYALRESALAHAESCGRCALLLTEAESLDFGLRKLASRDADQQAPGRLEAVLLQEFRRQKASLTRRRVQWQLAALAVAAAVVLALGLSLRSRSVSGPSKGPAANVAMDHGNQQQSAAPGFAQESTQQAAARLGSGQQEPSAAEATDSADSTAFVSLPYADDPSALEDGAVVRVVLSRSALVSLGVPVTDVGDTTAIPVDLVLSVDGTPQAIRLVSEASLD
jgi:hypothetical protein